MTRAPRHPRPSAIDGYSRLARTRRASTSDPTAPVVDGIDAATDGPRRNRHVRRFAGAIRLTAFVAVLALIVGTSVSLASSDPSESAPAATKPHVETANAPAKPRVDESEPLASEPVADAAPAEATTSEPAAKSTKVATEPEAAAAPTDATAAATDLNTADRQLPFTGEPLAPRVALLAGALLVLLGMLTQISGQPLPARVARSPHPR